MPGDLPSSIGRYQVAECLGQGSKGIVYSALDHQIGRPVAIKVMKAPWRPSEDVRHAFLEEARRAARVAHPNIVSIFDLGEHDGRPFVVMELLQGATLPVYLAASPKPDLDARLALMLQMCDGLQAAHDQRVIHRALRPGNIFVQRDGTLKILEFGIARGLSRDTRDSGGFSRAPEYASPEQVTDRAVDERSDVFSAGGVLYFILTTRAPFGHDNIARVLDAIVREQPAALTEREAPEPLARVVFKALEKDPERRHQTVNHLRAEIDEVRRGADGQLSRVALAALERYQRIEALIDQRRNLSRRLRLADAERDCDDRTRRLIERFPEFASARTAAELPPIDQSRASEALTRLQDFHNEELARLSVLRSASGDEDEPGERLSGRFAAFIDRFRDDSSAPRNDK